MRVLPVRPANIAWANASWRGLLDAGIFGLSGLLKKVFEVSRWATLIQDPSARRTKDSQPSGFGFEYCASHVRFRVFQQTARRPPLGPWSKSRAIAQCFLRLPRLDPTLLDRVGSYEARLWRQAAQTIWTLEAMRQPQPPIRQRLRNRVAPFTWDRQR